MRISDWSSDVCSSDLSRHDVREHRAAVSDGQLYRGPSPDDCERLVRRRRRRGDTIPDGPVYQVTSMREHRRAEDDESWPPEFLDWSGEPLAYSRYRGTTPAGSSATLGTPKDRKSVGKGKSVSVRVDLGGRRIIKKK